MKTNQLIIILIIGLLTLTYLSIDFLSAATQVTITGKGRVNSTVYPDGKIISECDNSPDSDCTITYIF